MRAAVAAFVAGALLTATAAQAATDVPVVATRLGRVSGIAQGSSRAYLGLPFAQPPVGDLRWRAPAAPRAWTGVRDGSRFSANCYQADAGRFGPYTPEFMSGPPVSEDCLYLNVWAPATAATRLPVLVWIHGGGFGGGSGSIPIYNGANLAARGAVVVTINYRVGPFGFMAHPGLSAESPDGVSGNYGLLDMVAALRWVQDNIASFGGDPRRVTVAGQSAGAMAINALLLSPAAKGLFAGAITESGTAAGRVALTLPEAEAEGVKLAGKVGAQSVADLRAIAPDVILKESGSGPPRPTGPRPLRMVPNVDGKVIVGDPFDPRTPLLNPVPQLSGYNRDEGRGVTRGTRRTPAEFETWVRAQFGGQADRLLALYPHATDAEATASGDLLPRDLTTVTHALFGEERARTAGTAFYPYLFEHIYPGPESKMYGTFHTAEVPYVFGVLDQQGRPFTDEDRRISSRVQDYWLAFMRSGAPAAPGLAPWPKSRTGGSEVMALGDRFGAIPAASTPERAAALRDLVLEQGFRAFL